jgi:hypothetical protein
LQVLHYGGLPDLLFWHENLLLCPYSFRLDVECLKDVKTPVDNLLEAADTLKTFRELLLNPITFISFPVP